MTLDQLEATLIEWSPNGHWRNVSTVPEASGVMFLCPKCYTKNGGPIGTHQVICWFRDRGVPDSEIPKPGRWLVSGTSIKNLTLAPSVQLGGPCRWHGFVRDGAIV